MPDCFHCSISINPGGAKVHIYVEMKLNLKVIEESIVLRGTQTSTRLERE